MCILSLYSIVGKMEIYREDLYMKIYLNYYSYISKLLFPIVLNDSPIEIRDRRDARCSSFSTLF